MSESNLVIALSSYVALTCSGILTSTGCGADHVDASQVALEIRFQDDTAAAPQPSAGQLRLALAAPGPTTHDTVARVLVDITFVDSGLPFSTNFELTKLAPDVWRGDVPVLPRNQQLRFAARALDASGAGAFSGETLATLTVDNQDLQIPLAPAQNGQTFQMPRMFRIVYPANMFAGQEEQIAFTILGNAGAAIGIQITPLGSPMTPAAEFSPATGTVTLTNTVADFMAVYTPPEVTVVTDFVYQVTITDARAQSAVAITTNFSTHIQPRPAGGAIVRDTRPNVLFNPVILSLTANGSETPGTVELVAAVSDDSAPDHLTLLWSYTPNTGTPTATFANNGQGNPGLFQGYTVAHQGTLTLAVTDEHNGTTTLHYPLTPVQFADAIDHGSVTGLKRIVAGNAHTCVLTGQNRVRCWGDNQFGQLGYGNAIDVGDTPNRLPYIAGDVPLPVSDPVQQLVAGNNHTCVLLQSGLVYCWGDNQFGQLGYNRTDNLGNGEPVTSFGYVTLGDLATLIAAGGDHTCAILTSGALRCWGHNDFGQLGRGDTANIGDNEPVFSAGNVDLGAGVTVKDLALGGHHTCALLTTGAVRCWGRNDFGQLGYGNTANLGDNEPINNLSNVPLTGTVRKLVAGAFHTCALTFAGTLRCWGRGDAGQLGQDFGGVDANWGNAANELPSTLPSDINTGAQVTDVTASGSHTCALSSDGQLKCWGLGTSGQLGYGDFASQSTPPAAGINLDGVTAYRITAGAAHTCALRSNGTARCWGAGADGRLGRGNTATSATATGNVDIQIFTPQYTVGGTVSGLAGKGLVLRDNGGDDLPVNTDGTFTFPKALPDLSAYAVTVRTQPTNRSQTCAVSNGAGNLAGANVTNVAITCVTNSYSVGGTVTGLAGTGMVLQNNAGDDLAVSANGTFTFATPVASGATFEVTVRTQPSQPPQTCMVSGGTGTVGSGNVTNVAITCTTNVFTVGGTVSGLAAGDSITLRDNGGDNLVRSANGSFTFATPVARGQPYVVTIVANPTSPISQTCTVTSGAGTVGGGNVTSVAVTCTTNAFTVGGTVSGLAGSGLVLRNNAGDNLAIGANGAFAFATSLTDLAAYAVTVQTQPTSPSQTCTVSNGSGNVAGANVTNVAVSCVTNTHTIGGTVSGLGTGQSVVLQNNGGNNLTVSANGGFTFTSPVANNSPYAVTVLTNPPGRTCTVSNGSGTVTAADITNVAVTCSTSTLSVDYLIVAGGGGGAGFVGGGGGGGGGISGSETIAKGTYSITVGSGGAGGSAMQGNGGPGGSSSFNGHTAIGGGGGAAVDSNLDAGAGGSGGGGSYRKSGSVIGQAGAGTAGQGFTGGNIPVNSGRAGGGGGFSGAGGSGSSTRSGDGGQGLTSSISGSAKVYGAGGGGAAQSGFTSAGGNGGTNAGNGAFVAGAAAAANLGGGGGGGGFDGTGHPGGAGGSGVVIIRYPGLPIASGGTITQSGGSTIHTFTATATFVVP